MNKIEKELFFAFQKGENARGKLDSVFHVRDHAYWQLHDTIIAHKFSNILTLKNGTWETKTTKSRINAALNICGFPARVYSRKFEWRIRVKKLDVCFQEGTQIDLNNGNIIQGNNTIHQESCLESA